MIPSKEEESLENSVVSEAYVPVTPEDYSDDDIPENNTDSVPYAPEYPNDGEDIVNQNDTNPIIVENQPLQQNQQNIENSEKDKVIPIEELENSIKETNNASILEPIELSEIDKAVNSKEDTNSEEKGDNNESNGINETKQLEDLDLTKSLKITKV